MVTENLRLECNYRYSHMLPDPTSFQVLSSVCLLKLSQIRQNHQRSPSIREPEINSPEGSLAFSQNVPILQLLEIKQIETDIALPGQIFEIVLVH